MSCVLLPLRQEVMQVCVVVQIRSCVLRRPTFAQIGVDRTDRPVARPDGHRRNRLAKRRGPDGNPDGAAHRFT
jgi:hypothetical protein